MRVSSWSIVNISLDQEVNCSTECLSLTSSVLQKYILCQLILMISSEICVAFISEMLSLPCFTVFSMKMLLINDELETLWRFSVLISVGYFMWF